MEYLQVTDISELAAIDRHAPFKLVLASEDSINAARRRQVAGWLVESGCRLVMLCGVDIEDWREAMREANLAQTSIDDMQPEDFVMITAHPHERLRGVFWHAKKVARHTHLELKQTLVVHVGRQNRLVEYKAMFDKA